MLLEERLKVISDMETEGCDEDTIEALMECIDGKGKTFDQLTPEILEELMNEKN